MLDEKMMKLYGTVDVVAAGACATVEIVSAESPTGRIVINETDYDPSTMELYSEEATPKGQSRR